MQVNGVIEQLIEAAKAGKAPASHGKVRLDWEAVEDYALTHVESVQRRTVANKRRFLTDDEYEIETGKKWDENNHDRKYSRGIYEGQDGIYARDKLGIQMQDERLKGMTWKNKYDNGGEETEADEQKNVFAAKCKMLMGSSGWSTAFATGSPAASASSSVAAPQKQQSGAEETQKSQSGAEATNSTAASSQVDAQVAEEDGTAKGSRKAKKGAGQDPAAKAGSAKAKAKPKGRPPKSITQDAKDLCATFLAATSDDVLWWGQESKTQLKKARELKKSFEQRISGAQEEETITTLEPYMKKVSTLVLLMEAQQKSGFDSVGFVEVYDCCLTSLRTSHMFW